MAKSSLHLRALTFAGVVILVSGLMIGLFQEARAVSIDVADPSPSSIFTNTASATFDVSVDVPQNERLPLQSVRSVVERTPGTTKTNPTLIANVQCTTPIPSGCDPTGNSIITKIVFLGSTPNLPAHGDDLCANDPSGDCTVTHTGYGYTNPNGFGYEIPGLQGTGYNDPSGSGYGYNAGDLTLNFRITVAPTQLGGAGNYWLTFIAETGSSTIGDLQSPAKAFTVSAGGGGGGGGGGTGPVTGPGSGPISVSVGQSFNGQAGQTIQVTSGLPTGIQSLSLVLSQGCNGCSISVTVSTTPPAGSSSMAPGFTGISFLTIELRDSNGNVVNGGVSSGTLGFEVNDDDLPGNAQPRQVLLLRDNNGWRPLQTSLTSGPNADPHTFQATLPGFSVFAIAVDTAGPSISNTQPTGTAQQVTPSISASWTDNRGIETDTFTLTIDGEPHGDSTGDLTVTASGFTYIPGTALDTSEHTVEATIGDTSGLSTTETWSFTISTPECPVPPRILSTQPTDGASGVAVDAAIEVTIEAGSCDVDTARLTINGEPVAGFTASVPAGETGTATAVLPTGIGFEETVNARAQIEDTGGNKAAKSWSFDTAQEGPGEEVPPEDGGISGWWWFLIILVVLIAAGVGSWYWYDQQQNGGGRGGGGTGGGT